MLRNPQTKMYRWLRMGMGQVIRHEYRADPSRIPPVYKTNGSDPFKPRMPLGYTANHSAVFITSVASSQRFIGWRVTVFGGSRSVFSMNAPNVVNPMPWFLPPTSGESLVMVYEVGFPTLQNLFCWSNSWLLGFNPLYLAELEKLNLKSRAVWDTYS